MKIKELLVIILLVIPATLSLFKTGFFGASDDMHIAWLQQMNQSVSEGQIPPRYVSDLSFGFGYPLFNFIFPLPYYLGEIFHLTGLSFTYSIKAVFIFSLFASAITMYFLARKLSGKFVGTAAAVLYIYTPYRSTDIYDRGALGESLAFVFLPLIIFFLIKVFETKDKKENYKWIAGGILSVAGLILTHNIVSYMFIPFAFLFGLIILNKKIKELFIFFFGGLLGSVYFWLPALLESKLMKYETVFNFFDHFPTIKQLITPFWGYGASVPGPYDGMSFFIGEVNLVVIGIVLLYAIFHFSKISLLNKKILTWSLFLIAAAMVMMNFRSSWLWKNIPLIAYFQFPWRFLTMIVFGSSLLVVLIKNFKYAKVLAVLIIMVSIGLNISRFRPHDFLNRDDSYYINRYIPVPTPSEEYLGLQEEYLRLPKTTETRPKEVYARIYPENSAVKNITLINSLDAKFTIESESELTLNYNKYYFPGWKGLIDGKKLNLTSGTPYGQIQFTIPSGKHEIIIKYRETIFNRLLDGLSLLTVVSCFYFVFSKKSKLTK
ncbi:MAG: hypothetical protein PHE32_02535 [Candidatus Shapirobacteria bacterium]|nr:hypothetical protein [Candidatus Shapirobacteria bacterium]MDD4410549.1 hypothetical protein [Candidatus Shapirobacteria bacterium]